MNAILYTNNSDERYVDKDLTVLHNNISCIFKGDSSVVRPTIILNHNLTGMVNYVWLEDLGRYYFVREKTLMDNRLELQLECDVLSTYKNELRNTNAIISRNEFTYNLYLQDDKLPVYAYPAKRTIEFPSGFNMGTQQFILGIAGGEAIQSGS